MECLLALCRNHTRIRTEPALWVSLPASLQNPFLASWRWDRLEVEVGFAVVVLPVLRKTPILQTVRAIRKIGKGILILIANITWRILSPAIVWVTNLMGHYLNTPNCTMQTSACNASRRPIFLPSE